MKTRSRLYQTLPALLIAVLSIFAMTPANAQFTPTPAQKLDEVKVTPQNYVRAESDYQFKSYIETFDCFGKFVHWAAYDVTKQITVRGNRDTYYSFGVFDLTSPLTVTMPEPGDRYQSVMAISQDHSIGAVYGPTERTLTKEIVGSRYVMLVIRTFVDPNDKADEETGMKLQREVLVEQADKGTFEVPNWKKEEIEATRNSILVVAALATETSKMFGIKEELEPVYWMLGAALGWGGLPAKAALYENIVPEMNDGKTAYTLTIKDVPVDAFWSVTLYDGEGWIPLNETKNYSFNNITSEKNKDGSITIHFGGDPKQANFLPIVPGWNYIVRLYRPQAEILEGGWKFPEPEPVK
jgi:hypothetical protein